MWKVKKTPMYPREFKIFFSSSHNNPGYEDNLISSFFYTEKEAKEEADKRNKDSHQ